ncbi:MAG: hypothetical protein JOY86_05910 [Candidatus Eremiobacteraeota bacterium]|nr:hypothetical protein [Candidatus Eremiobacteraeota bacterium]
MRRFTVAIFGLAVLFVTAGCAKQATTTAPASGSAAATPAPLPARHDVDFNFSDVAITTSGAPLLRLGFTAHNISKDPIQCDASEFSVALSDGSVIQADQSAENKCSRDMIDPGATANVLVFFDMKPGYTGPVTLSMSANDAIVGKGTAQVK